MPMESWLNVSPTVGSGDKEIVVSAAANEGKDRETTITVTGGGETKTYKVKQEGKREDFVTSDGNVFGSSDGEFIVKKQ